MAAHVTLICIPFGEHARAGGGHGDGDHGVVPGDQPKAD